MNINKQRITLEEKDNKLIVNAYRRLLRHSKSLVSQSDVNNIKKAFRISLEAHKEMRRKSGEPFILHPISVAQICVQEIGLGATSIIAALLHDVVEDTDLTLKFIEKKFGFNVARICDGLTKISGVFTPGSSMQSENFKKMLLTLVDDMRVILIKLADRLHNMRTLESMSRKGQLKISSETIYVYSPLAHRLGLYSIKSELDDLYLKYTDKKSFNYISNKLRDTKYRRDKFIKSFIRPIKKKLKHLDLKFKILGRPKSIFSINNKIKNQDISFEDIYDLFAIRIILDVNFEEEKTVCWQAYSVVTDFYHPNSDRLKDWISTPKANGYESLHTTVMSGVGKWVEVQIRSTRMDDIAEKGFAAHWKYKEKLKGDSRFDDWISSIRDLVSQKNYSPQEFLDDFRGNLYNEEIFIFTPNGDLKTLPINSTVLDFAYSIHSEIGSKCTGAIIDKVLVPLTKILKSGDQVNVITSTKQKPSEDWINKAVTSKAKSSIKSSLIGQRKNLSTQGKDLIKRKFKKLKLKFDKNISQVANYFHYRSVIEFYYDIAKGIFNLKKIREYLNSIEKLKIKEEKLIVENKSKKVINKKTSNSLILFDGNNQTLDYSMSSCCNPIPGDDIFGFVTINEGIKVHRTNCSNSPELLSKYAYRVIKAEWFTKINNNLLSSLLINGTDRIGVLDDITKIISSQLKVNMKSISINMKHGIFEGKIELFVSDTLQLFKLIEKLQKVENVISIKRID
ncbi:MAG TPA: bifunctional (p)ppGpp synthetase/guanosine-3',5'-bis(diphosphate) 3'-pyrophosphohydrolase [Cytophagales bacterium]|nr:bifunctional (p)ppGpp synthetase/guanosine-3',5'-bis(diphosphate) 3'-pyrophosphohydrolase [Cytophagales bacterium]